MDSQQGKESGPGPRSGGDKGVGGCGLADEGLPRAWVRSAPGLAPLCPGPGSALQSRPPARLAPVLGQPLRAPSRSLRGGCPFREEPATELGETADPWEGGRSEGQQPWAVQVWGGGAGSKQLAVGLEDKRLAHRPVRPRRRCVAASSAFCGPGVRGSLSRRRACGCGLARAPQRSVVCRPWPWGSTLGSSPTRGAGAAGARCRGWGRHASAVRGARQL